MSAKTLRFEVIIVFLAFVLVLVGVYLLKSPGKDEGITIIQDQAVSEKGGDIIVDIAGAVEKPGVYTLKAGTRMAEAIEKAGGFTPVADTEWISKTMNMAVKLSDAAKIYIPQKGEKVTNILGTDTSGAININSASEGELDKLSGVGPVTAQKIIDGRPYSNLSDLIAKKILTQKAFDKIKDQISVF